MRRAPKKNPYQMNPVQDTDPQGHKGLGEVDHLLALRRDGEARHGQVGFLRGRMKIDQRWRIECLNKVFRWV